MAWTFFPQHDKRQRIRIERLLFAAAASLVSVGLTLIVAVAGYLPYPVVARFAVIVLVLLGAFYGLIRSGFNLRFSDPSLTVPLLVAAGLATSYVVFEGGAARPTLLSLYLFALLFGMLSLDLRRLLAVAVFYLACYVCVVLLELRFHPETDFRREAFRVVVFAVVFGVVSAIGGYIHKLRAKLRIANARLAGSLAESQTLARIDGLTGCYNRRHGLDLLGVELSRVVRGGSLSVGMADIDHFKAINDTFGHKRGDEVLKVFARTVQANLRATDFLARYGGEEFLIVFSQTSIADAAMVAERIRKAVADMPAPALPQRCRVTVSIGVAEHLPSDPAETTIALADTALYQAKDQGRNCVVSAP